MRLCAARFGARVYNRALGRYAQINVLQNLINLSVRFVALTAKLNWFDLSVYPLKSRFVFVETHIPNVKIASEKTTGRMTGTGATPGGCVSGGTRMTKNVTALRLGVSAGAICAAVVWGSDANAGAFALREQSTTYQGMSYAGSATGDHLSGMFWNSAAAAAVDGFNTESHAALVIPDSEIDANGGAFLGLIPETKTGDIGDAAVVPASYMNYQLSERLYLGLAVNSPFGFTTKPDNDDWAGSLIAETSEVFSVNLNPTLAYKVTPEFTVGVGVQAQYIKVRLSKDGFAAIPMAFPGTPEREIEGDDIAFGATAGVTWQPTERTSIGLGFRSAMDVELDGTYKAEAVPISGGGLASTSFKSDATADFILPELVTLSLRQNITPQLAVLGTVEWTNWSRLGEVKVKDSSGDTIETLAFNYEDGWFYSVGLEYQYSPALTLRTGLAYEESPITDETRNVLLPDNDRIWLSLGATYKYSEKLSFDVAYTHIFVDDGTICRSSEGDCDGVSTELLTADTESSVDIISASVKYKISDPVAPLEPLK